MTAVGAVGSTRRNRFLIETVRSAEGPSQKSNKNQNQKIVEIGVMKFTIGVAQVLHLLAKDAATPVYFANGSQIWDDDDPISFGVNDVN